MHLDIFVSANICTFIVTVPPYLLAAISCMTPLHCGRSRHLLAQRARLWPTSVSVTSFRSRVLPLKASKFFRNLLQFISSSP